MYPNTGKKNTLIDENISFSCGKHLQVINGFTHVRWIVDVDGLFYFLAKKASTDIGACEIRDTGRDLKQIFVTRK